jgi:hypothetical protein
MLRRSSIVATAMFALTLGACSKDSIAPESSFGARSGYAIVDPPTDPGTTPPAVTPQPQLIPVFVIGNARAVSVGSPVNFWGAHWSTNNPMTGPMDHGLASFKGYITQADLGCGGTWVSSTGWNPPNVIAKTIAVIVTSTVQRNGPDFSGNIEKIVTVVQDGGYGPGVGNPGYGVVTGVVCTR